MPYIPQNDRKKFSEALKLTNGLCETAGELNYLITSILLQYVKNKPLCYSLFNTLIGMLECIKQELYRRHIAPYEDEKIVENGDV